VFTVLFWLWHTVIHIFYLLPSHIHTQLKQSFMQPYLYNMWSSLTFSVLFCFCWQLNSGYNTLNWFHSLLISHNPQFDKQHCWVHKEPRVIQKSNQVTWGLERASLRTSHPLGNRVTTVKSEVGVLSVVYWKTHSPKDAGVNQTVHRW
jgi:hypothetical protein